jgi:hypothetical protein
MTMFQVFPKLIWPAAFSFEKNGPNTHEVRVTTNRLLLQRLTPLVSAIFGHG